MIAGGEELVCFSALAEIGLLLVLSGLVTPTEAFSPWGDGDGQDCSAMG